MADQFETSKSSFWQTLMGGECDLCLGGVGNLNEKCQVKRFCKIRVSERGSIVKETAFINEFSLDKDLTSCIYAF